MSVTRLDSIKLADAQAASGVGTEYISPVQFSTSFLVSGDATGLSITIEVYDGANWVSIDGFAAITANGAYTVNVTALGIRANVTAITGGAVTVVAVFADPN
jgi:hypothetical protein